MRSDCLIKLYVIIDQVSGKRIYKTAANNGKAALMKFRREHCMSTGMYEFHKRNGVWEMSSTYGAYFIAKECK